MSAGESSLEAAVARLAGEMAPDLLREVIEASRRDAAEIVRAQLTAAMVEAMRHLAQGESVSSEDRAPRSRADERPPTEVRPVRQPAGTAQEPLAGWYVYGLTWDATARSLRIAEGVEGAPVEVVSAGPLAAVVSPMSTTEPWGLGADGDIDIEALAPRARQHESVLEQILEQGAVLPLRFGVLYPSADRLRALLVDQEAALSDALGRVDGRSEWGLTIAVDGSLPVSSVSVLPSPDGRDYLARRRAERLANEEMGAEVRRAAADIHDALVAVAADAVVERGRRSERRRETVVLRASYLVAADQAEAFRSAAERALSAADPALRLTGELTGPWPPYHFCDVSLDQVPA